jgi:hypothetical protein
MITLFEVPARQATQAGGIDSLESISERLKSLKIRTQVPLSLKYYYFLGTSMLADTADNFNNQQSDIWRKFELSTSFTVPFLILSKNLHHQVYYV